MFPKIHRLPGYRIPEILKTKHTVIRGDTIDVHRVKREDREPSRIAVICPMALSKKATKRNRTKRLIRESLRPTINNLLPAHDVIIMAKKLLSDVKQQDVEVSIIETVKQSHISLNE